MAEYYEANMYNFNFPSMRSCIPQEVVIKDVKLARAYIPFQKFCILFPPIEALKKGTIFPELYSMYEPKDKKIREDY